MIRGLPKLNDHVPNVCGFCHYWMMHNYTVMVLRR